MRAISYSTVQRLNRLQICNVRFCLYFIDERFLTEICPLEAVLKYTVINHVTVNASAIVNYAYSCTAFW